MKTYEIKTYSFDWHFKKTINPKNLNSIIDFQEELNGGQWNINLVFRWDLNDFMCSDIVEIREKNDRESSIIKTYTGIIEEIGVKEYEKHDELDISILWVFTVLNDTIYKSAGNRTVNITATPGAIVKSIIDSFNADYGNLYWDNKNLWATMISYTVDSIDVSWTAAARTFTNANCLSAIKTALEDTWFDFFIGADGICTVKKKTDQIDMFLTYWRELLLVQRDITKKDMANKLYFERNGGNVQVYQDAPSISIYGMKEKFESDTTITDLTTQNTVWAQKILEYTPEKNVVTFVLKPQNADFMYPGAKVTTRNTRNRITQWQVTKIEKNFWSWKVYLGNFVSFWKTVLWG